MTKVPSPAKAVTEQNVPKAGGANPISTGADQQLLKEVDRATEGKSHPSSGHGCPLEDSSFGR